MLLPGVVAQRIYAGATAPAGTLWANAARFDGTSDYLERATISGLTSSKFCTISYWIRVVTPVVGWVLKIDNTSTAYVFGTYISNAGASIDIVFDYNGTNSASIARINGVTDGAWHHITASVDLTSSSTRYLYVDGVDQSTLFDSYPFNSRDLAWSSNTGAAVGALIGGTSKGNFDLSELYLTNEYIDLSVEANRRKFITADMTPADMGTDGSVPTGTSPLIYLSNRYGSFQTNNGTGGNFTEYGVLTYSRGPERVEAAYFDGTDKVTKASGLTGAADNSNITFSGWINLDSMGTGRTNMVVGRNGTTSTILALYNISAGDDKFSIIAKNVSGTTILRIDTVSTYSSGWHHVMGSWNGTTAHLYVDGVSDKSEVTNTSDTIDWTLSDWAVGCRYLDAVENLTGDLSELYLTNEYIDLSVQANREKFITADGRPAYLGFDGSLPTGTAPLIYLNNKYSAFEKNKGTGGDFTVSGLLAEGRTVLDANGAYFDGTNDWLKKTSALTGIADGKQGTISYWFRWDGTGGTSPQVVFMNIDTVSGYNPVYSYWVANGASSHILVVLKNSSNTIISNSRTVFFTMNTGQWYHFLSSWDLATNTHNIYMDGISSVVHTTGPTNDTIDYLTTNPGYVFSSSSSSSINLPIHGDLAEFYFTTEHIDLSVQANREKFRDSQGRPVFLGLNGELPTGTQPLIYLKGEGANYGINSGSGGDFTEVGPPASITPPYPGEDY